MCTKIDSILCAQSTKCAWLIISWCNQHYMNDEKVHAKRRNLCGEINIWLRRKNNFRNSYICKGKCKRWNIIFSKIWKKLYIQKLRIYNIRTIRIIINVSAWKRNIRNNHYDAFFRECVKFFQSIVCSDGFRDWDSLWRIQYTLLDETPYYQQCSWLYCRAMEGQELFRVLRRSLLWHCDSRYLLYR